METILLEDVLHSLDSNVAIMKIDVESMECKVQYVVHCPHIICTGGQNIRLFQRLIPIQSSHCISQYN